MLDIWTLVAWHLDATREGTETIDLSATADRFSIKGELVSTFLFGEPAEIPSPRGREMMSYLPWYYGESRVMESLMSTMGLEFDSLREALSSILDQFFVTRADWGLDRWDDELGLPRVLGYTTEQRRQRVLAKLRGFGTTTIHVIKEVALIFDYGDVDVIEDHADYSITIRLVDARGIPPRLVDFQAALRDLLPAHLGITYVFVYFVWDELDAKDWDWNELDALALTWDQIEVYH